MSFSSRISVHSESESSASASIALHKRTISKLFLRVLKTSRFLLKTSQIHTFCDENAYEKPPKTFNSQQIKPKSLSQIAIALMTMRDLLRLTPMSKRSLLGPKSSLRSRFVLKFITNVAPSIFQSPYNQIQQIEGQEQSLF